MLIVGSRLRKTSVIEETNGGGCVRGKALRLLMSAATAADGLVAVTCRRFAQVAELPVGRPAGGGYPGTRS